MQSFKNDRRLLRLPTTVPSFFIFFSLFKFKNRIECCKYAFAHLYLVRKTGKSSKLWSRVKVSGSRFVVLLLRLPLLLQLRETRNCRRCYIDDRSSSTVNCTVESDAELRNQIVAKGTVIFQAMADVTARASGCHSNALFVCVGTRSSSQFGAV